MGYYKPDGRCWTTKCQNLGTEPGGTCTEGNPVMHCKPCADRIRAQLMQMAKDFAVGMSASVPALKAELAELNQKRAEIEAKLDVTRQSEA